MRGYLVLKADNTYVKCSNRTALANTLKDLDVGYEIYDMEDADVVAAPTYLAYYNDTRGELTVHDLDGNQLFSDNEAGILHSLDHTNSEDMIYMIVEDYYKDILEDLGLI